MEGKKFQVEFDLDGIHYLATVQHVLELSPEELQQYNIREESFLVHLFTGNAFHSFEIWVDDDLEWHHNGNQMIVTAGIADNIGAFIDNNTM